MSESLEIKPEGNVGGFSTPPRKLSANDSEDDGFQQLEKEEVHSSQKAVYKFRLELR